MSAWGHAIVLATAGERANYTKCIGKCGEPCIYVTSYRYVTGRAGRISRVDRVVCKHHGERFAEKYGLQLPNTDTLTSSHVAQADASSDVGNKNPRAIDDALSETDETAGGTWGLK